MSYRRTSIPRHFRLCCFVLSCLGGFSLGQFVLTGCDEPSRKQNSAKPHVVIKPDLEAQRPFSKASWQMNIRIRYDPVRLAKYGLNVYAAEKQMAEWASQRKEFTIDEMLDHQLKHEGPDQVLYVRFGDVAQVDVVCRIHRTAWRPIDPHESKK